MRVGWVMKSNLTNVRETQHQARPFGQQQYRFVRTIMSPWFTTSRLLLLFDATHLLKQKKCWVFPLAGDMLRRKCRLEATMVPINRSQQDSSIHTTKTQQDWNKHANNNEMIALWIMFDSLCLGTEMTFGGFNSTNLNLLLSSFDCNDLTLIKHRQNTLVLEKESLSLLWF